MGLGFILQSQKMSWGREKLSGPLGAAEWPAWEGGDAGGGRMRGGPGLGCGGVKNEICSLFPPGIDVCQARCERDRLAVSLGVLTSDPSRIRQTGEGKSRGVKDKNSALGCP